MKKIRIIMPALFMIFIMLAGCAGKETDTVENSKAAEEAEEIKEESQEDGKASGKYADSVVWLGDSLTQGSLGDDNDNIDNAPYVKLAEISGLNVEGKGYYGYNTDDIFYVYTDEARDNNDIDPDKVYVLWVGSNDWVVDGQANTDTDEVFDKIDGILEGCKVDKYIILGTTARYELRKDDEGQPYYEIINEKMADHYKDHYLDTQDIIGMDGYGPDDIHLKQESYDAVAKAVYDKLIDMGYIEKK